MEEGSRSALEQAIRRMWDQFLPELKERVALIERAARALGAGNCTPETLKDAYLAAHKLAGVLGTFGLMEGTELAREAENLYEAGVERAAAASARLLAIAARLRQMIDEQR
ncbi:MAG TPA: Hpt domain-containing protein [Terracidiphilus sp.]|nr:Hpt domain-containing protein [Terracidiphilus sp.]